MPQRAGRHCIGTSGYQYPHWRGTVYPEDLPKKHWFDYYSRELGTVEINNTFYNLPAPETFSDWYDAAPENFLYALKFSRYGSHIKRLKDPEEPLQRFLEHAKPLGDKLGPILVQLPPHWKLNLARLEAFVAALPGEIRWVIELRDPSWLCESVYDCLRAAGVALCIHDMIADHPFVVTADWLYLRYHGGDYTHNYTHQFLAAQAGKLAEQLRDGRDIYAYFNNDNQGYAFHNARQLRRYLDKRKG